MDNLELWFHTMSGWSVIQFKGRSLGNEKCISGISQKSRRIKYYSQKISGNRPQSL